MADEAVYEESPYSQYQEEIPRSTTESRSHNFVSFTFRMPHYCDYCRNFLWGLVQQVLISSLFSSSLFLGRSMRGLRFRGA
jgi:hypothetical protein